MKKPDQTAPAAHFAPDPANPMALLACCPVYEASPLSRVMIGTDPILVKDESNRMGLDAFKALGGIYAVGRLILSRWQAEKSWAIEPSDLISTAVRDFARGLTFVCASAGNHGLAVAAGARLFGANARVHLSDSVPSDFVPRLQRKGADIVMSGADYEASMRAAISDAETSGAILLADSSWDGYAEIPCLVMEGYTVIAEELRRSFEATDDWPTHVFLQAGVGGLAAAITYMIRANWQKQPDIIIVEPDAAACLWQSHLARQPMTVAGPVSTMGRLDCKEPSRIAFDVLEASDVAYVQISDQAAAAAVELLDKTDISTTPSGAAGLAGLLKWQAENSTDGDFTPLVIVSEGSL